MSPLVTPLHYVIVNFRLRSERETSAIPRTLGQHRFLYGVETWISGVDQHLQGIPEGETLELLLEPESSVRVASYLWGHEKVLEAEEQLILELEIVKVEKAEAREVIKALAASVKCCDHCGGHE